MTESRREFFDRIATQWDGFVDLAEMGEKLRSGLLEIHVAPSNTVVDLGCGTGNLSLALLERLGPEGRVVAVDFSPHMVREAQRKVKDDRVTWVVADAADLPLESSTADYVICFSAWPHFPDPERVLSEVLRVLRPGGELHIWHAAPRATINHIHAEAGGAVERDSLPSGHLLAALVTNSGLQPFEVIDDERRYLVRARAPQPQKG
jgi:ubiquinone/menaquinone biosynthesis C-methylase UbiE